IKENRRVGNISAGPTSHLLEGVTWDEARRMQDASMSAATDHVILVGAASKGIIQRDFQHNAVVYKTPYAKNPFDSVTDKELDEYRNLVERKQRGDPLEEVEIEKMNIMPERAMVDVVDDSVQDTTLNTTAPTSPTSDQEDGERVVRQKPSIPPKPDIPKKPTVSPGLGGPGVPVGPPQRVQATMRTLPLREEDGAKDREPSPPLERSKSAFYKSAVATEKRSALARRSWSLPRKGKREIHFPIVACSFVLDFSRDDSVLYWVIIILKWAFSCELALSIRYFGCSLEQAH
ncbi:hypothetical protein SK128_021656, partial [Halocaridina rubra]